MMETQTGQAAPPAGAALNGHGPAPAAAEGEECADCATASERVMGIIGLLFAAGLAAIAFDLLTGGALTRAAARLAGGGAEGEGGQPSAE